jgi:hypothetical protein
LFTGVLPAKSADDKAQPPNNEVMEDLGAKVLERLLQHGQFEWEKQSIQRQIQYYDNADPGHFFVSHSSNDFTNLQHTQRNCVNTVLTSWLHRMCYKERHKQN